MYEEEAAAKAKAAAEAAAKKDSNTQDNTDQNTGEQKGKQAEEAEEEDVEDEEDEDDSVKYIVVDDWSRLQHHAKTYNSLNICNITWLQLVNQFANRFGAPDW